MEFRILGPLEVVERGRPLPLGGSRQRALLALLLTRANEVVSADRLIDELWRAQPPRMATNALQYHVSQLRKTLAPSEAIVTLNGKAHKAMADQITTVSKLRLSNRAGRLSVTDLAQVERVVKLQLDLKP